MIGIGLAAVLASLVLACCSLPPTIGAACCSCLVLNWQLLVAPIGINPAAAVLAMLVRACFSLPPTIGAACRACLLLGRPLLVTLAVLDWLPIGLAAAALAPLARAARCLLPLERRAARASCSAGRCW